MSFIVTGEFIKMSVRKWLMARKTYHGFCHLQEQWADNRRLYQDCLDGKVKGMDQREAKRELDFLERFSPEVLHDRVVAHALSIYSIKNPAWSKPRAGTRIALPHGEEEKIMEIDLGSELVRLSGGSPYVQEVVTRNVVKELSDGTFIRGDVYRYVLPEESSLRELEQYVSCIFEDSHYSFSLLPKIQSASKVIIYDLTKYVSIDGQLIKESRERVLPGFVMEKDAFLPTKFGLWVTKKRNQQEF